ncbi:MAG: hypothetical protein HXY18_02020 [Bryobacteraceae bacterium]|jgi:hypothetical protein|nr:hypothetical protein [Bryobacteraceae bacterium]
MNTLGALLRAIRGPLLLIVLGGLLALARFQGISFTKTWPVLLIALGLLKLAERLAAHPGEPTIAGGD